MDGRTQTGLVACSSIDDYLSGTIKKHENTRQDKEIDRIKHVGVCEAQTGPILLAYRSDKTLKLISAQVKQEPAMYDFITEDGIGHKVWKISDKSIKTDIESCFYNIEATYIADGHHRAASAVKVGMAKREANINYTGKEEFNYFLSVLFPDDELMILPYNRAVKDIGGLTDDEFFDKIKDRFYIKELEIKNFTPSLKDCFGLYFKSKWYELRIKEQYILDDPVGGLDASILQDNLLAPVLGIEDPRTDKRISFVGGIRGAKELERMVDSGAYALALDMYPTQMSELLAVADAGLLMPPKSTWFEPKLRSGIFIHDIGEGK